jgi:hypothetical protein
MGNWGSLRAGGLSGGEERSYFGGLGVTFFRLIFDGEEWAGGLSLFQGDYFWFFLARDALIRRGRLAI